jgi:hypothetical protein
MKCLMNWIPWLSVIIINVIYVVVKYIAYGKTFPPFLCGKTNTEEIFHDKPI